MFDTARLRLTAWYTLTLAMIVALLSVALYQLLLAAQHSEQLSLRGRAGRSLAQVFARDERTLAYQIIAIDLGLLLVSAAGAYFLAGRTLAPIREVMERQRRFAAAASHELRTPLTALRGNLEVALLNRRTPEEYQDVIRDAVADTDGMGRLVKDLTMLGQAEMDVPLALTPVDAAAVVREALEVVQGAVREKGQTVEMDISSPLPIRGDPLRLRQAVLNLLDNAVTYTAEGGAIHVGGKRERGHVVIEVRDTGVGIPQANLAHLFEPFYQVDIARSAPGHVGLGLALAAWIVRAHHGQIEAVSREGMGSVFTITLPLAT